MIHHDRHLIVVGGATATGKTSLAIKIALHYDTEILSADSRQCFKEMNIGVAKPGPEELNCVHHHFINSHSIQEKMSAGIYADYGTDALNSIFSKRNIAICVGGTGLYIKALCEGLDEMPPVNSEIAGEIEEQYEKKGLEWLRQELQITDPALYAKMDVRNPMRLLRGLIFYRSNGESILTYQNKKGREKDFSVHTYQIETDRKTLYRRIDERVDEMIGEGLVAEVDHLRAFRENRNLKTVGYTELFDYFDGKYSLETAIDKIKQHTRNYAKRQITWFRNQAVYKPVDSKNVFNMLKNDIDG